MEYSLKMGERAMDLILVLGVNETIHQLVMANSVHWYSQVLWRVDVDVLRRALDF